MNITKTKKTEKELRTLLQDAVLLHDFIHILSMGRKMRDQIFQAVNGTMIAQICDSPNPRELYPLIELSPREYRATVKYNTWMQVCCTEEGMKKAAANLKRWRKSRQTTPEATND